MTLKGSTVMIVTSIQNIVTLFLEFQVESLNKVIIIFTWPKVTKRRYIIAVVYEELVYVHTAHCMKPLLKNYNVTSKVCTVLKEKGQSCTSFPPMTCLPFRSFHCLMDKKTWGSRSKKICFYNKPFYFIFSIFLYTPLLLRFLLS